MVKIGNAVKVASILSFDAIRFIQCNKLLDVYNLFINENDDEYRKIKD